jgi:hypothetical protein
MSIKIRLTAWWASLRIRFYAFRVFNKFINSPQPPPNPPIRHGFYYDDSMLYPIKRAIYEDGRRVIKIHVAHNFFMRVKAVCTPPIPDAKGEFKYTILGYDVCEHFDYSDKDFWIEFEGTIPEDHCKSCGKTWREHRLNRVGHEVCP